MRISAVIVSLMLVWAGVSAAQDVPGPRRLADYAAVRELTDKVMAVAGTGDLGAAIRLTAPYTVVPGSELETMIGRADLERSAITQRSGVSVGHEFIREDRAGDNFIRIVQISRYERSAIRWEFVFYRSPRGWSLNSLIFDGNLRALFLPLS